MIFAVGLQRAKRDYALVLDILSKQVQYSSGTRNCQRASQPEPILGVTLYNAVTRKYYINEYLGTYC